MFERLTEAWQYYFNRAKAKTGMAVRTIQIQAAEGERSHVMIESMLTALRVGTSIPGTVNAYNTYESQVGETYRKYNSFASFGCQQARAVVDLRVAFICGEGISVSVKDENTSKWIEDFLEKNKLDGTNFINAVKGSEMAGQSLFLLKPTTWQGDELYIKSLRIPYQITTPYRPVYSDPLAKDEVMSIMIKREGMWVNAGFNNFVYVRTGGDDANSEGPVTKVGVILTDLENYDRAIKDMRRNNHIFARITPNFQTKTSQETGSTVKWLTEKKWKLGEAVVGTAEFEYKTPKGGAHENLETELAATIKTISGVTGIPVHWLGYVDLMSNRATAESLYELIKNKTIIERSEWESSLRTLIIMAQELYINNGGRELSKLDRDFQVRLPLIDFGNFLELVRGLSLAYNDEAISIDDYRNNLPGIDPTKTERAVEIEKEKNKEELKAVGQSINLEEEEEENEGEE